MDGGRGRTRAPDYNRSEKTETFHFPGLSQQRAGEACRSARPALSLERGVRTRSFGREQGKGLGLGLQRARDLVLGC